MDSTNSAVTELLSQTKWNEERKQLRAIALGCGLKEEVKWAKLCYTFEGSNVAIIYGLKDYCALGFFKGALLKDTKGILFAPGEHSQAMRQARFTSVAEITNSVDLLKRYIREAIEIEQAGLKVEFKEKEQLEYPEELKAEIDQSPLLGAAFEALTPGRRRGYILHFSQAKQSKTRKARIEKCVPGILAGQGLNDR